MLILSISKQGLPSVALATKNFIVNTKLKRNFTRARYLYSIFDKNFVRKFKFEYYFTSSQNEDIISVRQFQTRDYITLTKGYDFKIEKSENGLTEIDILSDDIVVDNERNSFDYIEFNNYSLTQNEDFRKYIPYFKAGDTCLVKTIYLYNIKEVEICFSVKATHDGFTIAHYDDGNMNARVYNSYFQYEEIPDYYVYFPTEIKLLRGQYLRFIPHSPVSNNLNFYVGIEYEILE